jgi:hypothetical protein
MKKDIKKFFVSFCIVVISLIIIDNTFGFVMDKMISKFPDNAKGCLGEESAKINFSVNRLKTDILIVGSSRANHHYISSVIKDSVNDYLKTNYNAFNAGHDGNYINLNSCIIQCVINRQKPKIIIFDAADIQLEKGPDELSGYSPYYYKNKIVKNYINTLGMKTKIKMHSNIYRYNNGNLLHILLALRGVKSKDYDGYDPIFGRMKIIKNTIENNDKVPINKYTKNNFLFIIDLCKKSNVKLIITCSPLYSAKTNNYHLLQICKDNNVPFIDMINSRYFNSHPELFQDQDHLNDDGAKIYTTMFFQRLKPYLK